MTDIDRHPKTEVRHNSIIVKGRDEFIRGISGYNPRTLNDLSRSYCRLLHWTAVMSGLSTGISIVSAIEIKASQYASSSDTLAWGAFVVFGGLGGAVSIYMASGLMEGINIINSRLNRNRQLKS